MKRMEKDKIKMSLFWDESKGIYSVTPFGEISLPKLVEIYQSNWLKVRTESIWNEKDEEKKKRLKSKLPFVTPYGCFAPTRNNESLVYYNSNIIAFDIDGVGEKTAIQLRDRLAKKPGCLISVLSPRKRGLKSFFLISDSIPIESHVSVINHNLAQICKALDILEFSANIDEAQFKLCQALFLNYDPDGFFNLDATPLELKMRLPEKKIHDPIKVRSNPIEGEGKKRIQAYLVAKTGAIIKLLQATSTGERYKTIPEVIKVKSNLHYLPEITDEIKESLKKTVEQIYCDDPKNEKKDALKYFEYCWDYAKDKPNPRIEEIINELAL